MKSTNPKNKPAADSVFDVITLSKYTSPNIVEKRGDEFVSYGEDNLYFNYLVDRYLNSATNNACINGIVNMIVGKGLDALDSNRKPDQYAQLRSLINDKELRKIIQDRKIFNLAAIQVTKQKGKVTKLTHFPMDTLRSGKTNKDGIVDTWYYHPNWAEHRSSDKLKEFKVFGHGDKSNGNELYIIKPYVPGYTYYPPVDYVGGVPYAFLEEEIADYLINDTINGFSGTKVINFNNGVPDKEKQLEIKRDITKKLTGARGEKVIVAFNNNSESATTVQDLPLDDAPAHYQYLSDEARGKIIVSHRVTSPLLLGIREDGNGLGSNADEIKNASTFFDNIVVKPYQYELVDALEEILSVNDINLKLYFKTIQPLEFIDTDGLNKEQSEEETGVKMNADFNDDELLNSLSGEKMGDEWELVDEREYDENNTSVDEWANKLIKPKQNFFQQLADVITAKPNGFSYLDKTLYKVRYSYTERYSKDRSRPFCVEMMLRTGDGIVYRLEDIDAASRAGVHKELGHKRQPYDLFKFKGGVNCSHFWTEKLYRLKDKTLTRDKIENYDETSSIPKSAQSSPIGTKESKIAPVDMPNRGHHPNYNKG